MLFLKPANFPSCLAVSSGYCPLARVPPKHLKRSSHLPMFEPDFHATKFVSISEDARNAEAVVQFYCLPSSAPPKLALHLHYQEAPRHNFLHANLKKDYT